MVIVAVIDDGLNYNRIQLNTPHIEYEINKGKAIRISSEKSNMESHGLLCSKIIETYCNKEIFLISIKVKTDCNTNGSILDLKEAIDFCTKLNVNIISLSLGTDNIISGILLKKSINKAVESGIIIVSALSNEKKVTYPACFENVVAVRANIRGIGNRIIHTIDEKHGEIFEAWPQNTLQTTNHEECYYVVTNSFACPAVVARIINLLDLNQKSNNIIKVIEELKKTSFITQKRRG